MIKISEVEQVFKDMFEEEDGVVRSIETLYETLLDDDFLKLIISIHGLTMDDVSIIHTKFIFKVDKEKNHLVSDSFIYLYNINCNYHRIEFESIFDMENKLENVIKSNDFGKEMQILSDFIEAPSMFLNYYLRQNKITDYSIFDVKYDPKFKTTPCANITFDFEVNIDNNYTMDISIRKIEATNEDETDSYKFQFKFMDDVETEETDTLKNIHFFLGSNISKILDKKLKNK